jgi:hypothetical protein
MSLASAGICACACHTSQLQLVVMDVQLGLDVGFREHVCVCMFVCVLSQFFFALWCVPFMAVLLCL